MLSAKKAITIKIFIRDLSERIKIVYFETTRNKYGDIIRGEEITRCEVWARVHPLAVKVEDNTPEKLNKITYRITIRWQDDIAIDDEIVWRGRRFKIISTNTEFEVRHVWRVFDVQEITKELL